MKGWPSLEEMCNLEVQFLKCRLVCKAILLVVIVVFNDPAFSQELIPHPGQVRAAYLRKAMWGGKIVEQAGLYA